MPPLGGGGFFPVIPGTTIYGPVRPPRRPTHPISARDRDIPLPETWPYPPSSRQRPLNFPAPPLGRTHHRQTIKFTPWILNLSSRAHKCVDRNLFREPRPGAAGSGGSGTVVLPILPGPKRRCPFFDVTVMTLSNVEYTPQAEYSELSWPLLQQQGFTRHVLHNDHTHDVTYRTGRANARQYRDGADIEDVMTLVLRPGSGPGSRRGVVPRPGRNIHGGPRFRTERHAPSERCGRLDKEDSVIRHVALPGVDLLWCGYDSFMNPGVISVQMTGVAMVDLRAWSWGVEAGIVGRGAGFRGDPSGGMGVVVGWVARYAGEGPHEEPEHGDAEDLFRRIVQGGLLAGEDLVREMGVDEGGRTAVSERGSQRGTGRVREAGRQRLR
ncbi:hypothetical protein A1O7_00290 [Cladophialophora yegresii CBS 114405]|uniref:Uncharacterized protein n=1 Tax=Cladophialophora yegresii CBS 114405 TaxID=1182544 RepID=W9WG36_9EURO|nr:uncharacterized protein A1O7_00290 [Cladophialophora yegresii CBS 114405]EXJ63955.1 hypothetical protein A1O7_00290 [Cladophialophora yegresii CBS 114405]